MKAEEKDNETIAFIYVLVDLFPYNQYCDRENEKKFHTPRAPHIRIIIFVL